MTRIGIISDTHVSEKRGKLNRSVFEHFRDVDLILHAGDITFQKVLDELSEIAPVIAVKGNNDKVKLKSSEYVDVHNFKLLLNHGTDFSNDYNKLYEFGRNNCADIVVTGHTHKIHKEIVGDILLLNPGTARGGDASIAILNIDEKDKLITDIDINFIKL